MVALTVRGGFVKDTRQKGSMWIGKLTSLPKGTTAVSRGTITFRETEKGWISSALSVDDGYCTEKALQNVMQSSAGTNWNERFGRPKCRGAHSAESTIRRIAGTARSAGSK